MCIHSLFYVHVYFLQVVSIIVIKETVGGTLQAIYQTLVGTIAAALGKYLS